MRNKYKKDNVSKAIKPILEIGDLIKARFLSKSKTNDYKWFGFVVEVCEHDAFYVRFFDDPMPNNKHLFHIREQSIMWIKV